MIGLADQARVVLHLAIRTAAYIVWSQSVLLGPAVGVTLVLWVTGKIVQWALVLLTFPLGLVAIMPQVRSKTVLLSGGSTVQALHLARNLHRGGMRVVLCEVRTGTTGVSTWGRMLSPARFSVAVARFYSLPDPALCPQAYVRSLCDIVSKEQVNFYVPLCQSTAAYYDAFAKPHLERLGCFCFCPAVKEVWAIEGIYEFLDMANQMGLPIPICFRVTDRQQVMTLFERGAFQQDSYVMLGGGVVGGGIVGGNGVNVGNVSNGGNGVGGTTNGTGGVVDGMTATANGGVHCNGHRRVRVDLASKELDLMRECLRHKISEQKPWVILQQPEGHQFVTCTSVKDNHVVSNVTCRVNSAGLELIAGEEVIAWIQHFLAHLPLRMTGYFTFKFVKPYAGRLRKTLVPLGCQIGASLPLILSQHDGVPWRRCQHLMRVKEISGPAETSKPKYWLHQELHDLLSEFRFTKAYNLIKMLFRSEEAIFAVWDPVPFLVYYHLQAPLYVLQDLFGQVLRLCTLKPPLKEKPTQLRFIWNEVLANEDEYKRGSNGVT